MTESKFDLVTFLGQESLIFKDEQVFDPTYIPEYLVHRNNELTYLATQFKSMMYRDLIHSGKQVVIQGPVGSGKTAVAKHFGFTLENYSRLNLKSKVAQIIYFHLNCRRQRSWNSIFTTILRQLVPAFPIRGFSADELLTYLIKVLEERDQSILLCLDEFDYILYKGQDMLYSLIRYNEGIKQNKQSTASISLILVTRNPQFQTLLDPVLVSSLSQRIIKFERYTNDQLFDILSLRALKGLKHKAYSEEVIKKICEISSDQGGEVRYAIELLWRSGKFAEQEGVSTIKTEHVKRAQTNNFPIKDSIISDLPLQHKTVLRAIALLLNSDNVKTFVTTTELKKKYIEICKKYNLPPRKQTQFWVYLQDLAQQGLIELKIENRHNGKGKSNGRTSIIRLSNIPVSYLLFILQ